MRIDVKVEAGSEIGKMARKALRIAHILDVDVHFKFNDHDVYAHPSDNSAVDVADRYFRAQSEALEKREGGKS